MALTNFSALTQNQKTVWSKDLWRQARAVSFIDKFTGESDNSMIQRITELKKDERGARAVITLLADLLGDGVAGDNTLKGNEEAIVTYDQVITIDQLRHANKNKGRIAEQKTIVKFREASKNVLSYWLGNRIDQVGFLTIAGVSYAYANNGVLRTNLLPGNNALANLAFANNVTPPTTNRRARLNQASGALEWGNATSALAANDTISWASLIYLKAAAKLKHIRPVIEDGGEEVYHVFLHPRAMANLKMDPDYMANLRYAAQRDKSNPLFTGTTVKVDGLYLHEHEYVFNTLGAASGSKWGSGGTVDGCSVALCGAQALGMADIGDPTWVEDTDDYENQLGISTGKIFGLLKPQFNSIYEPGQPEDFGVLNMFVAIK